MSQHSIDERIREIAAQATIRNDLELVHMQAKGAKNNLTIRIFIDKEGGVTHDDCVTVSREVESVLDSEDFIPSAYLLEVSSPGLERELYSLKDFEKFVGKPAKVRTHAPIDGQRNFRGRIVSVKGEEIVFEDKTRGEIGFSYDEVAKANLEIDIEQELKREKG
jgi:ribosome maturation factor RimP